MRLSAAPQLYAPTTTTTTTTTAIGNGSGKSTDDGDILAFYANPPPLSLAPVLWQPPLLAHESALHATRIAVNGANAHQTPTYGTESRETMALMRRLQVLRLAGIGEFGVVLVASLGNAASVGPFALKLQPMFRQLRHAPLVESEQNNATFREVITLLALNQLEDYERSVLNRAYGEMTLHTVRMVSWGSAVMSPAQRLALPTPPPNNPYQAERLAALGVMRSWQYIVSELVAGGDGALLARYACTLLRRDPSGMALERLVRCMLAQVYAQLVVLSATNKLIHRDLQLGNVFWQVVSEPHTIYYQLPHGARMRVPLVDTAPLGFLPESPVARGYLLFKIGDFGLSSVCMQVRNNSSSGSPATTQLHVGPTLQEGGEYNASAFFDRFDYSMIIESLRDHMRNEAGFAHYSFGGAVAHLHAAMEKRRIEDSVRLQLLTTEAQDMTLYGHSVSREPWAGSAPMVHELFGSGAAPSLFDTYCRTPWLDSELTSDPRAIAMRYMPSPSGTIAPERLQMPAMSVDFERIDSVRVRALYAARSLAQ